MALKRTGTVDYPTSDGRPMAETDLHREIMFDVIHQLKRRYAHRDDVYVTGNLLLYYVEGDKRRHVSPDAMVVFGVRPRKREYYLLWEEKAAPAAVLEITSKSTRREDTVKKKDLYLELGVEEYFLFDPRADYIKPRLRGYRRSDDGWVPLHGHTLRSETLGLDLRVVGDDLQLIDATTGERLLTDEQFVEEERRRADDAQQRADDAQQRADDAQQRADEARKMADEARQMVDEERRRAEAAEAELRALRRQLESGR